MERVVITTGSFGEYDKGPLDLLKAAGREIVLNPYKRKLKKEEILDLCRGAVGIIAGTEMIDADVMKTLTALKVISRCGTGLDNVDLDFAWKNGIKVFNTPDAPTTAVAELTVGLILDILRRLSRMDADIRALRWRKVMGSMLCGKKVGIIGFGRIGKKVAGILKAFNCEIKYADPFIKDDLSGFECLPLDRLLKWADIVSIHASAQERIIGDKELKMMKNGAWLINVSRGGVVDEAALLTRLKEGRLSGAALDVFQDEPYDGPFRELDNVVLTPHIGSYAREARVDMEFVAVENLLKGLKEESA